jgi:uncharacterized protein
LHITFEATGHPAILSTHPKTIEITKESHLSSKGDCIVAVNSTLSPSELSSDLRSAIASPHSRVEVTMRIARIRFIVRGLGDERLTLSHPTDFVIRKSGFISNRTLMIHSDRAASDIPRDMVQLLKDPAAQVRIELSVLV